MAVMTPENIRKQGDELYHALRTMRVVEPLSERYPDLDIDTAYAISLRFLERRRTEDGERVIGKKIGVTSKPVQDMLGVFQPDFGFLTDAMRAQDGDTIQLSSLIQPRIEAEIAFELERDLVGPGVTPQQVLAATKCIYPCFEVVDSRIHDWRIKITDTIADNASCGVYALGKPAIDPRSLDLPKLQVKVYQNETLLHTGEGAAVQGDPLTALAWLANTLGAYHIPFLAGEIILSGSLVPLTPLRSGEHYRALLFPGGDDTGATQPVALGDVNLRFI